ncbi:MAG: hypothetical protein HY323_14420 [Betaproteobacteria bacterium]|nr:hypothetical protein [Betaproteobacteria bacterium]
MIEMLATPEIVANGTKYHWSKAVVRGAALLVIFGMFFGATLTLAWIMSSAIKDHAALARSVAALVGMTTREHETMAKLQKEWLAEQKIANYMSSVPQEQRPKLPIPDVLYDRLDAAELRKLMREDTGRRRPYRGFEREPEVQRRP